MEQNGMVKLEGQGMNLEAYANNLKTKLDMAQVVLRSGMCPASFKTPEAVLTAILYGQEVGFSPMQSLQAIQVIQGKPTISAAGMAAKALEAGGLIEEIEHTEKICRLKITRGKTQREFSFTWAEAEQMGLASKDNWKRMPKAMLYARCVSVGVRYMFADKILGLYSTEEMLDSVTVKAATVEVLPKVEDESQAPPKMRCQYDLGKLDPEKRDAAIALLRKAGATTEDELLMYWDSPVEIKKLANYRVGEAVTA